MGRAAEGVRDGTRDWTKEQSHQFEEAIARFEQAWHQHPPASIEGCLPAAPELRLAVLIELVAIDKEFRARGGQSLPDSEYHARFPELLQASSTSASPWESSITRDRLAWRQDDADHAPWQASCAYACPEFRARGGLGEIFVVDDVHLNRRVVVKRLQARWRDNARAVKAFVQEAEVTGRLEHPGIVPIHAVGETLDGRPWYSMRFVLGATLAEAIAELHRQNWSDGQARNARLRWLLTHFVAVANTIGYAHSRGVLHRDLKPSNIMLGPFGETLVLDWGMAKLFAAAGLDALVPAEASGGWVGDGPSQVGNSMPTSPIDTAEDSLQNFPLGAETLRELGSTPVAAPSGTRHGDLVGTPAFMSPEQARGAHESVGPATDVFGLGSILYAILTGCAPYQTENPAESVRLASHAEFLPPQKRDPEVPAALNAICCRAMALEPTDRYGSPIELAHDVENYLAGEPIAALAERWDQRAVRYVRRRRHLMSALALVLTILPLVVGAAAWLVAEERAERQLAARTAELRGESTRKIADYLIRTFRTADPIPFDDPGFASTDSTSKAALRKMLDTGYELQRVHLLDQPELRSQLLVSLGSSYLGLADYEKAKAAIGESQRIRQAVFGPRAAETLESQHYLARIAHEQGDYRSAESQYREVILGREKLAPPQPLRVAETKYHLAWLLFYQPLGLELPQFQAAKVEEAQRLFLEVLAIREQLLPPDDRAIGMALAGAAAASQCLPGQQGTANLYSARALEVFRASNQETALGNTLVEYHRAEAARREGRLDEADALYQQLLERGRATLGANHPSVVMHLWNMAGLYRMRGDGVRGEQVVSEIRAQLPTMVGFRSMPANVDALMQYGDALRTVDRRKSDEVFREALQYARERAEVNGPLIAALEQRLAKG